MNFSTLIDILILGWLIFTWFYEQHHKACSVKVICEKCGTKSNHLCQSNNKVKEATCAFIPHPTDPNLFLGVSRKDNHNAWGLPGGKKDKHESLKQCTAREIKEETGLDFSNLKLVFVSPVEGQVNYLVYCYTGDISGNIHTTEKGKVDWVSKDKLLEGPFGKYNKELFSHLKL